MLSCRGELVPPAGLVARRAIGPCSWESSQPPKLTYRVRILAGLLTGRRGLMGKQRFCKAPHAGSNPFAGF